MLPRNNYNLHRFLRGFTLVELLLVLVVVAILLSLGVPSFLNILASNRVAAAANEIVVVLNLGKSEAVRSGQTLVLCKRQAADTQCSTSAGDWDNGWLLFIDGDNDNQVDAGERVVRVQTDAEESLDLAFSGGGNLNFSPDGGTGPTGRFCLRNSHDGDKSRVIRVSGFGRFQVEQQAYDCA